MEISFKDVVTFKWFKQLHLLYIFGFLVHFQPANPFVYEYLIDYRNDSFDETRREIFPISIYGTAVQTALVFLLFDICKFNFFISLSCLFGITATCINIWGDSLLQQQLAHLFYGSVAATEIAYYASIYVHVEPKHFTKFTSLIRLGPQLGKCLAAFLGQIIVSQKWLDYRDLLFFNLGFLIIATVVSIFLPAVAKVEKTDQSGVRSVCSNLSRTFPNKYAVKWIFWLSVTLCGYNQVKIYIQPLWRMLRERLEPASRVHNGTVEGLFAFISFIGTLLAGPSNFDWKYKGDLILTVCSLVQGFALILASQLQSLVFNYLFYTIFGFIYHFIMTMLTAELAKFLQRGNYGIVTGMVVLLGSIVQSGLVYLVIVLFDFDPREEFMVYGYYHLSIAIVFIGLGLGYWLAKHNYH